jgi:hypothetical protein
VSSASRFPSPSRSIFPKAGSSPPTPRPCRAIPTTATRLRRSSLRSRRRSAQALPASSPIAAIAATTHRPISLQGLYLSPEAMRYRTHQARTASPPGCRAGHRPRQRRASHGPQLPRKPARRCGQRRPCRRGIRLPKTAGLAQALAVAIPVRDSATHCIKNSTRRRLIHILHGRLAKKPVRRKRRDLKLASRSFAPE